MHLTGAAASSIRLRWESEVRLIERWSLSLWFDLKIIFMKIFKGFVNKNAY